MLNKLILLAAAAWSLGTSNANAEIAPTFKDVPYGTHPLQKMDIYLPPGDGPFPFIMDIHAGGWWNGDKQWFSQQRIDAMLAKGCALVTINYRFLPQARADGLFPPVLGPFHDARRALQFARHHAGEYRLDAKRVGLSGGSAGGCTALWLGLSPEMADAAAADPVERESTRVTAIGVEGAQTSLDPAQMREWVGPELKYGGHAFGLGEGDFAEFLKRREEFAQWYPVVSPAALVNAQSPPVYLWYDKAPDHPKKDHMFYVHSPMFGVGFQKLAESRGATCYLVYPGLQPERVPAKMIYFLIEELTKP
ncbi:MAG: alpha/beta hydrolase [Verrucomicrobiales bacterium]|jgi:acetyl esterase/lipase|nr:alpha/beta hydrolase [Verrucomicrobiales bacterium]